MLAVALHCVMLWPKWLPQCQAFLSSCVQKQKREIGSSPHEPFFMVSLPWSRWKRFPRSPFAGITCLDHMITRGCKGVWESKESGKGDWLRPVLTFAELRARTQSDKKNTCPNLPTRQTHLQTTWNIRCEFRNPSAPQSSMP